MADVQLRQTYYDQVYNYKPHWIIRWGLVVFFFGLLVVIILSMFVKYPDVIPATVEITTINPPEHIMSRINGKIKKIWVSEGQLVDKGEKLVLMETSVTWQDVQLMEEYLQYMKTCHANTHNQLKESTYFRTDLQLGELQTYYSSLLSSYTEYLKYYEMGYLKKEIASKTKLLASKNDFLIKQKEKKILYEKLYEITRIDHSRDSSLLKSKTISSLEFENSTKVVLQHKLSLIEVESFVISNNTEIEQLRYDIEVLKMKDLEQSRQLLIDLQQNEAQLSAQLDLWKQNYVLTSNSNGKVTFTNYWSENQNATSGDIVISIIPLDSMRIRARAQFPIQNSGKVKPNQKINIKLENYPYTEFGLLQGKLISISKVPNNSFYSTDILLDKGFTTSYNKELPAGKSLNGVGEILTDDYSLFLRLFNPLKSFFTEKVAN